MELLYLYLLTVNALGLMIMLVDKHNAVHGLSRIPERGIWTVTVLGGSLGCLLGMHLFRHKTKKCRFRLGIPLIFAVQLLFVLLLVYFHLLFTSTMS